MFLITFFFNKENNFKDNPEKVKLELAPISLLLQPFKDLLLKGCADPNPPHLFKRELNSLCMNAEVLGGLKD